MTVTLTPDQAAQIRPMMQVGQAVLGRVTFRRFDGDPDRCGEMEIEIGHVPETSLPALREAIRAAGDQPKPKRRRKPDVTD